MASITHATVATGTNNPDKQVSVNAWNADHIVTGLPISVVDYGAVGDGTTDDAPAIQAALDAAPIGGAVYIPVATARYRCASTLVISKTVHLFGDAQAQALDVATHPEADLGSALYFDAGVAGIILKYTNDSDTPGSPVIYPGAGRSVIERLMLYSATGKATFTSGNYGIESRTFVTLRDVYVRNFGDNGICIRASISGGDGVVYGNANKSRLDNVTSTQNAGHGFFISGNDANACQIIGCFAQDNAKWGYYDDSLIGNCYMGNIDEGNDLGNVTCLRFGTSTFYGHHTEGGLQNANLNSNCNVYGGLLGGTAAHDAASSAFIMSGALAQRAGYRHINHKASPKIGSQVGSKDATGGVFAWGQTSTYNEWKFVLGAKTANYWGPQYAGSSSNVPYQFPDGTNTTGRGYALELPNGVCIGNASRVTSWIQQMGSAAPTTGTWVRGDIIWNTAPSASGKVGWVCVTAGTPGTWKAFGAIDA